MKYLAVKLKGFEYWIWFEKAKVTEDIYSFKGVDGWGRNGAGTSIEVDKKDITGRIESSELQYR